MKHGWMKVAAITPKIRVADVPYNTQNTAAAIKDAEKRGVKLAVFPELGLTGYTCGDLFFQQSLIRQAEEAVLSLAKETAKTGVLSVVGFPLAVEDNLYNAAAFLKDGNILGIVTKSNLPNHGVFCEKRYFTAPQTNTTVMMGGQEIPVGPNLLFCAQDMPCLRIGAEICEDLFVPVPTGVQHALHGATVLVNPAASNQESGKSEQRRLLVKSQSARAVCAYLFANAGEGESTTDLVFGGHNLIYENGTMLAETEPFGDGFACADIDLDLLVQERRWLNGFGAESNEYKKIPFSIGVCETKLERRFPMLAFVPEEEQERNQRCGEVFAIQYHGLMKRISHIGLKTVTIGISGGLDSALALLVTVAAFDALGLSREGIIAVTMPCFGTSERTYRNAKKMIQALGVTFREINIRDAVTEHLKDIGADINDRDVTYENAQARERTQVLMDVANKTGGIVIGTGDLSELALGFATYNGDHMSMYGVNASVPKTLMRYLIKFVADQSEEELKRVLYDVLDTPVSPELLPPAEDGSIAQQTEEIVGSYELHDFFLYHLVRWGFCREKIQRMAERAFAGVYDSKTIDRWLGIFLRRFTQSQFKRSCLPDGPKVGRVGLSPRGDFRMPSDTSGTFS